MSPSRKNFTKGQQIVKGDFQNSVANLFEKQYHGSKCNNPIFINILFCALCRIQSIFRRVPQPRRIARRSNRRHCHSQNTTEIPTIAKTGQSDSCRVAVEKYFQKIKTTCHRSRPHALSWRILLQRQ